MTGHFTIALPVLARGTADRSEELRRPERLAGSWAGAEVLVMDGTGRVAVDGSAERPRLVWAAPATDTPPPGAVLLGSVGDVDHWAVPGTVEDGGTIRSLGPVLDDTEAGLLTTAVAVLNWHARSGFCPVCGRPTTPDPAGWSRVCPVGHQEWPRTDPAVIVLIHDGADRMLLARQPSWPAGAVLGARRVHRGRRVSRGDGASRDVARRSAWSSTTSATSAASHGRCRGR